LAGGTAAMISMQGGHFVPIPFASLIDRETGRAKIRLAAGRALRRADPRRPKMRPVAAGPPPSPTPRRYMIRLRRDDFEDPHELAKFAATVGIPLEAFRQQFEYLVKAEPPPPLVRAGV